MNPSESLDDPRREALRAALAAPSTASWERIADLLDSWPRGSLDEAIALCQAGLARWPRGVQRTPLRSWLQPELDGQAPHPLMELVHAPGGVHLRIVVVLGQLSGARSWVLESLDDRARGVIERFWGVFAEVFPAYGQDEERAAYMAEVGVTVDVTLRILAHGWEVERVEQRLRLDAPESFKERFDAGAFAGLREPAGEPWTSFYVASAYAPTADAAGRSVIVCEDHLGLGRLPRGLLERPHRLYADEGYLLVADGDRTALHVLGARPTKTTIERPFAGFSLDLETPKGTALWRGADRLELLSLSDGDVVRVWRWQAEGAPRWPERLEIRWLSATGSSAWTKARMCYVADFGPERRVRWHDEREAVVVPRTTPGPDARSFPAIALDSDEVIAQALQVLERLGMWRPASERGAALVDGCTLFTKDMSASVRAMVLFRSLCVFGRVTREDAPHVVSGLLAMDRPLAAECRRILERLREDGLLEWSKDATEEGRATALLLLAWARRAGEPARRIGPALAERLRELDAIARLRCDDQALGRRVTAPSAAL